MPDAKETKAPKVEKEKAPKEDPKVAIPKLLKALKDATEQGDKRKIRARLRSLGHIGGLPKEDRPERKKVAKAEATAPAAAAPAPRRSRAAGAA